MNYLNPEFLSEMLQKYSHMSEEDLIEEVNKVRKASGKDKITAEDKEKLFQFVQPFLSKQEIEQLEQLLKTFE
ncbi:MAG: hypothetical protein HPY66_0900 [Firmicutes bacterium]|nr:hypothetical protein [Bacillota bacterium]MDI6705797.1 hypothetical protein [Bacillota bacterium]